ncbi:Six-hairpin glycosidase-like protein [Podospora fimiseda]|uniref:Six-hairpin glycosidase-like protein n=1 Tax=Podospora fimiseda TaxID=252190 RepID=A0AAN7BFL3_9PEZI|nr:Six-hairpin glycosidase-like protein [Podospora fimiseda]
MFTNLSIAVVAIFLLNVVLAADFDGSRFAWYSSESGQDFKSNVPIGNGRLGATVSGNTIESLVLNENSVWSGPWEDRVNPASKGALSNIRNMLIAGKITAAGQQALSSMAGNPTSPKAYQPLTDMTLDFGHRASGISNYTRWLDTLEGTAGVSYAHGGVSYSREFVPSYPHGVLAFRFSASGKGNLNVKASLVRARGILSQKATVNSAATNGHSTTLSASSGQANNPIVFWSEARIINSGGTVRVDGNSISVTGADFVDVFFNAETTYRHKDATAAQAELKRKLDVASSIGFPAVRQAAIKDFSSITSRVKLNLGNSGSAGTQPTPTRLTNYKKSPSTDPQLITLFFNFGRQQLAASSRDTGPLSLPANLQGIWNRDYSPAWQSKYTININLQMNYWPSLITNMAEVQKPVFDLINLAIPRAEAVANKMYGCDGIVMHHNTDLWGDSAPVDKGTPYTIWPMGAAWLSSDAMEHFRFTQNHTFLQTTVWPLLQKTAQFYYCYLFNWQGYYTSGPSLSPEHAFIVPSNMQDSNRQEGLDISIEMDNQLLRELFSNVIETCSILKLTSSECTKAASYLPKIRPPGIGPKKKEILEWRNEYDETEPAHRHFSNLWGVYPGAQLLSQSNYTASSKKFLDRRMSSGSGSTGWSRTWAINLYARLLDGEAAWRNTQQMIQKFPTANLWNSDSGPGSSFQIDGNFGLTAGVAEMLMQSHSGVIHLLPALSKSVGDGSVEGLVGRGNFVVDVKWKGGKFLEGKILARSGGRLEIKVQNGGVGRVLVNGRKYDGGGFETEVGRVYEVRAE